MPQEPASPTSWPPELDALVASPEHHFLRFENDRVRVLETVIPAGETTGLHTHAWPALYLIESWSSSVRRDADGHVLMDSRDSPEPTPPYAPVWSQPIGPHTLENVGSTELRLVSVEVKPYEGSS